MLEYLETDQQFHSHLVGLLGNRRWTAIVENLRDQSRITGSYHLQERGLLMSSAEEHRGILEAVLAGDEKLACRADVPPPRLRAPGDRQGLSSPTHDQAPPCFSRGGLFLHERTVGGMAVVVRRPKNKSSANPLTALVTAVTI
jgi:hypothetical protein